MVIAILFLINPSFIGFTILTITDISSSEPFGNWSLGTFEGTNLSDEYNNVTLNLTDGISEYALQGNYTSQIFSPGNHSEWTNLSIGNTSLEDTNITFQVKNCKNSNCNEIFVGPDNTSESFFEETTIILNETLVENSSFFQFKAFFHTNETSRTPVLEEVNISYEDINDPPVNFSISFPGDNEFINASNITIEINNATDIEDNAVIYYLEIYNDSVLAEINQVNSSIAETSSPTLVDVNLTEDGDYYLIVLATDSETNSSFSSAVNFTIDTILPANFNLTLPEEGASNQDSTPNLEWEQSNDTNLDNYTIEVSTAADFSTMDVTDFSNITSFTNWSAPLSPNKYYWRVTATDKANNKRQSDNSSSFTVEAVVETVTSVSVESRAGGTSPKPYSFRIIAPPALTVFRGEEIIVPLTLQNEGKNINLNNIVVRAEADTEGIGLSFDRNIISILNADSNETVNLKINAAESLQNLFTVSVFADVENPRLQDSIKIISNIVGEREGLGAQQQLVFAKKFFDGNLKCENLRELLNQAEAELQNNNLADAQSIISRAINSCKDLLASKIEVKPKNLVDITFNAIKENKTTTIVGAQVLVILIIALLIIKKFLRRGEKELKLDF